MNLTRWSCLAVACLLAASGVRAQEPVRRPVQIRVSVSFVEFKTADVEPLVREERVTVAALKELWRDGKGHLLASPSVTTKAGQEAVTKSVTEMIYPTEFTGMSWGDSVTNAESVSVPLRRNAIIPGSFETREVGVILQVLPEVTPDFGSINLTLNPQFVYEPEWHGYDITMAGPDGRIWGSKAEQPFFRVASVSTSMTVRNGVTVLVGGGATDAKSLTTVYIFVTATLVDDADQPLAPLATKATPR